MTFSWLNAALLSNVANTERRRLQDVYLQKKIGTPMQLHLHAPAFILLIARCQYCAGRSSHLRSSKGINHLMIVEHTTFPDEKA